MNPRASKTVEVPDERVQKRSVADFFQENKAIAGFDNPMRSVFTSVRELVENGLDAAEKIGRLPDIEVHIERVSIDEIQSLLGIQSLERLDKKVDFLRLRVRDNGSGVPDDLIPMLFGRVLTGSNYGARQTRGRFGLGAKMVLIYAMSTVDLPIKVTSRYLNEETTSHYELLIDLGKNEPIIVRREAWGPDDARALPHSGTEVEVTFTGNWNLASRYVREYFHQLAMITPYARFVIHYPGEEHPVIYERVVDDMPPYPKLGKIHPWGCDITQFKREVAATNARTMKDFLLEHFQGFNSRNVLKFLEYVDIDPEKDPKKLKASEIRRIVHEGFRPPEKQKKSSKKKTVGTSVGFRFTKPKADSLSPLGAKNLEWGVRKELDPDFVVSDQGEPKAYSGHPFIVEAAVAYGGSVLAEHARKTRGTKIYRFANRIPLLFGQGEDVITKVIKEDIDWSKYGVNPERDSIAIVVSIVSTKIPFPETSKEYIADVPEIRAEIRRVLNGLLRELKRHVGRIKRERRERERQSMYVSAAQAVVEHLRIMLADSNSPINLAEPLTAEIVETALASAEKKIIKRQHPMSRPLWRIPEWLDPVIEKKLRDAGINTVYQFLATESSVLSRITGLSQEKIKQIKRNSVIRGNFEGLSPDLSTLDLLPSDVEKDFESYLGMPRILKAFGRRWIVSGFDFAAASIDHLLSVEGLVPKLVHVLKKELIQTYPRPKKTEQQDATLSLDLIPWMNAETKKDLSKLGITSVGEYMIAPVSKLATSRVLALAMMRYEKSLVHQLVKKGHLDPAQPVLHDTFRWTSSDIRSRLRSKGVQSIENFLQVDDELLVDEELIRESLARISKHDLLDFLSNEMDFTPIEILPWMTPDLLKEFMQPPIKFEGGFSKIDNIPTLLILDDQELARLPKFSRWVVSKFHREVIEQLENARGHHDITNLLWLDLNVEKTLLLHEIETVFDFVRTLPSELKDIAPELNEDHVTLIKRRYGTPLSYLNEDAQQILQKLGIVVLEEFYYNPDLEEDLKEKSPKEFEILQKEREWLDYPSCFVPLPSRFAHFLLAMGIATVGQFLTWPIDEIKGPGAPSKGLLQHARETITASLVKERYTKAFYPATMLSALIDQHVNNYQQYLASLEKTSRSGKARLSQMKKIASAIKNVLIEEYSMVDLYYDIKSGNDDRIRQVLVNMDKKRSSRDLDDVLRDAKTLLLSVLEAPSCLFEKVPPEIVEPLARHKIKRFIDFYLWDEEELASLLSKSRDQVREWKADLGKLRNGTPLKGLGILSDRVLSALIDRGYSTFEDLYFKADESTFAMTTVRWRDVTRFLRTLDSPLVFFVMKPQKDLLELKASLNSMMPSEGAAKKSRLKTDENSESEVLEEINSLKEKIKVAEAQVETIPQVFRESGRYHAFVEKLADHGIDTVIKFLYWPNDKLALMTGVSSAAIQYWKEHFELKETGVPLEHVSGLSSSVLKALKDQLDITTVEGLYFLVNEDLLEDTDISWDEVRKPIEALELPLGYIRPYLREEYYQAWKKKRIDKILRFVITSDEELAQIIGRTADVVFLLKQSLYEKINLYHLRETADVVLNLFSQISREQLDGLLESDINTVYDFLTTDEATLASIMAISEDEVEALKETFTIDAVSRIKDAVSIELKEIKAIHDSETLKHLKSLGYDMVSSFYYQLTPEKMTELAELHPELNWEEVKIAHRLLDAPIGILPSLTRETVDLLLKHDVTTVIMFLTLPTTTIATYLSLTEDEALKLKKSVNLEEIVSTLSNFPLQVIWPRDYDSKLANLKDAGIDTVLDLLVTDIAALSRVLGMDEKTLRNFLLELPYSDLHGLLEIPINMMGVLDETQEKLLRKARIRTVGDFLLSSDEKIATVLQLNVNEVNDLRNQIDHGSIIKALQLPLSVFPEFQDPQLLQKLQHHRVFTLRDFYLQNDSDLASMLGVSRSKIRKLKQDLNVLGATEHISTEQWDLKSYSGLFDGDMITALHEMGIKTIQDFMLALREDSMLKTVLSEEQITKYKDLLSLSVSLLPGFTSAQVKVLWKSGIMSVADFLVKPDSTLASLLDVPPEDVRNFKAGLSMDLLKHKKATLHLADVLVIEAPILAALEEHGIKTLDDAFYAELSTLELPTSAQKYLERLQLALTRPVVFLKRYLPPQSIYELALNGIITIYDFLKANIDTLAQLGITEDHVTEVRQNLNLRELIEHRARQLGTSLTRYPKFLSDKAIRALQELNCVTYEELYFIITEDHVNKSTWNAILPVKETLDLPVCFIPEIQKTYSHKIKTLYEKGIRTIMEFLYWPNKDLALILGIDRMEALSLKNNIPLAKLKNKRNKLGTPLEALPVLDESTKTTLESLGITTVESLYFAMRGDDVPPPDILPPKTREAVLKLLNSSIMLLDGVPMHKVSELKRRGIKTIIDFLYWDVSILAKILGLRKKSDVEALKNPIRLRKLSELTKAVDQYFTSE